MCGTYLNSRYEPIYDIIDFIATVTEDLNSRTLVSGACIKLHITYLPPSNIKKKCVADAVGLDLSGI